MKKYLNLVLVTLLVVTGCSLYAIWGFGGKKEGSSMSTMPTSGEKTGYFAKTRDYVAGKSKSFYEKGKSLYSKGKTSLGFGPKKTSQLSQKERMKKASADIHKAREQVNAMPSNQETTKMMQQRLEERKEELRRKAIRNMTASEARQQFDPSRDWE